MSASLDEGLYGVFDPTDFFLCSGRSNESGSGTSVNVVIIVAESQVRELEDAENVSRKRNLILRQKGVEDRKADAERVVKFHFDFNSRQSSKSVTNNLNCVNVELRDVQGQVHVVD